MHNSVAAAGYSAAGHLLLPFGLVVWIGSTVGGDVGLNDQGPVFPFDVGVFFASLPFLALLVVARSGKRDPGTAEASSVTVMRNGPARE